MPGQRIALVVFLAVLAASFGVASPTKAQCRLCETPSTTAPETGADGFPLEISVDTDLDFDRLLLASTGNGTARLAPDGTRLASGSVASIGGRAVVCTGRQRDIYLRLLVSCRIGEVDINRRMVATGWAVAYGDYAEEEEAARRSGAGLWAGSFERPRDWRKVHGGLVESEHAGMAEIVNWLRQVLRFL